MPTLQDLIPKIKTELEQQNIVVDQQQIANATILKLDNGVLSSIYIDEFPSDRFKYRFNLTNAPHDDIYEPSTKQFFYNIDEADQLITQIINNQQDKLSKWGPDRYQEYFNNRAKKA